MLYSYTSLVIRDGDGHLSYCDEDVLYSPLRNCAAMSTPRLRFPRRCSAVMAELLLAAVMENYVHTLFK